MKPTRPGILTNTNRPDPLAPVLGNPLIGEQVPENRYLGRVVVELYESEGMTDAMGIVYTIDPANNAGIDTNTLAQRVANAFVRRIVNDQKK